MKKTKRGPFFMKHRARR